jgi:hypothetical protein
MGRVRRRCDRRCHNAKGTRCRCWCGGTFHGAGGAGNRAALAEGVTELLEQTGFKTGETAYIEQRELPLEVASVR